MLPQHCKIEEAERRKYVQGWPEMSFAKNTSILDCTFLRSVKIKKIEEVTSSGFVGFFKV